MKLHYCKILLFFLPLNILLTSSSNANTHKKPSIITPHHTPICTSRMLSEKDIRSTNYDNDPQMKSVKQQYDDRTSQRFQEYEERMNDKRQKRKEESDKNIEKIIEKDKTEKSLAGKVEKGCLRCGCALGGVAASVGLFGGLGVYGSKTAALAAATDAGVAEGLKVGLLKVTEIVTNSLARHQGAKIAEINVLETLTTGKFNDEVTLYGIFKCINNNIKGPLREAHEPFFTTVNTMVEKTATLFNKQYNKEVAAVAEAFEQGKADAITAANSASTQLYSAIGYSVLAILIIVLIMVIIYLVLRYLRKKKMKKKAEYTKLLNQ
ncbi:rifin [Plasmodium reichenowi]|uniref:Rifin n=1 Tax=Plasmodium reichenowi TaxID=5854 RepID=A0A060RQX6_PLARE|nr:rifin [Plasmodium reichenowi]